MKKRLFALAMVFAGVPATAFAYELELAFYRFWVDLNGPDAVRIVVVPDPVPSQENFVEEMAPLMEKVCLDFAPGALEWAEQTKHEVSEAGHEFTLEYLILEIAADADESFYISAPAVFENGGCENYEP